MPDIFSGGVCPADAANYGTTGNLGYPVEVRDKINCKVFIKP